MGAPFQLFFDQILPRSGIFAQILPLRESFGSKFSAFAQSLPFRGICCFETLHLVVNLPLSSLRNFKNFQATHQLTSPYVGPSSENLFQSAQKILFGGQINACRFLAPQRGSIESFGFDFFTLWGAKSGPN